MLRAIPASSRDGYSRLELAWGNPSPQRLKPFLLLITYVRAEARTLQKSEFFRSLYIRKENVLLAQLKKGFKEG
jgi:hypothetical protein